MFQKISIHKASLICGKPIKCRVSIFFTWAENDTSNHKPGIMFLHVWVVSRRFSFIFQIVHKNIQIRFTNGFQRRISLKKWGRRDLSCMATSVQEYVESMENREEKLSEMCNDVWSERHLKNNDYLVSIINDKRFTSFFFSSLYKFYFTFCAYNWIMRQRENRLSSTIMRRLTRVL